jgi:hypothetical protein
MALCGHGNSAANWRESEMASKEVIPALGLNSFSCPHCGAIAHQTWYRFYAQEFGDGYAPRVMTQQDLDIYRCASEADREVEASLKNLIARKVFFERQQGAFLNSELHSVFASECYSCECIAIWHADSIIYPQHQIVIAPNDDMPDNVKGDFVEANEIVDKSPKGAAALLRLCIQKLMPHLGEKGENLNDDIASLVRKGLDGRIQKALDVVRVIGNNAVHPGQINLSDDKAIASKLFGLVNVIVESQITRLKHIDEIYDSIVPISAKEQIKRRDTPKSDGGS